MLGLLVLSFIAGALAATTTGPTGSSTPDLIVAFTVAFNSGDLDHNGQIDVSEFIKVFDQYDANKDQKLTLQEYITATNLDKVFAQEVYKFVDHDQDGVISRSEVNRIFRMYDKNHNGVINIQEFIREYTKISNEILKDLPTDFTFAATTPTAST